MNLPSGSGAFADDAEPGTLDGIRRQSHVYHIELVEELSPELDGCPFQTTAPAADGRRLNQGIVKVVVCRPAEGIAAQGSETAGIGSGAPRDSDRYEEEAGIVRAPSGTK
ncbi:MAG: hypothetical protein WBW84_00395 [Acidobacteriaceae bacterium]